MLLIIIIKIYSVLVYRFPVHISIINVIMYRSEIYERVVPFRRQRLSATDSAGYFYTGASWSKSVLSVRLNVPGCHHNILKIRVPKNVWNTMLFKRTFINVSGSSSFHAHTCLFCAESNVRIMLYVGATAWSYTLYTLYDACVWHNLEYIEMQLSYFVLLKLHCHSWDIYLKRHSWQWHNIKCVWTNCQIAISLS